MKKNYILLFIIFILIISIGIFFFQYGNDFYWHLGIGKYMINNFKIPYIDVFSWYASENNLYWISHEWLFEIIIYLFHYLFYNIGAFIYVLIMLISIATVIFNLNKENFINNYFYTIIWALCGTLIFANKALPRPHLFSFLFFSFTIYITYSIKNKNTKLFYLAPLISILWANIHGGSSNLSYIIYFIFLLFSIFTKNKNYNLIKKYLYCFISSLLSILINPHGIKMIIYPYLNMTYSTMINCIDEWQSLNIISTDGIFYILFILSIIFIIIKNRKKFSILNMTIIMLFIILGIKSTRFIPYLYIVVSAIIPNYWKKSKIKINLLPILISIIIIIVLFYSCIYKNQEFEKISPKIINYITENKTSLYNSYNLGGYLIYKEIPVFIDSRADLYVNTILCDVCEIEKNQNYKLLEKYNFDTFLIENKSNLYHYLNNNNKYKLIINDHNSSLFKIKPED